jgi:hypothetical protein
MDSNISSGKNSTINVKDEKEFKLWIKFIASVHKNGGDINKPTDILWKSILGEIRTTDKRCRI